MSMRPDTTREWKKEGLSHFRCVKTNAIGWLRTRGAGGKVIPYRCSFCRKDAVHRRDFLRRGGVNWCLDHVAQGTAEAERVANAKVLR